MKGREREREREMTRDYLCVYLLCTSLDLERFCSSQSVLSDTLSGTDISKLCSHGGLQSTEEAFLLPT